MPPLDFSKLASDLDAECAELSRFVTLLQEEHALLTATGNAEQLVPLVERKTAMAQKLASLATQREAEFRNNGVMPQSGKFTLPAEAPAELQSAWEKLLQLALEARTLNETNGMLIEMHWKHNQAALAALMSAVNQAGTITYGADGQHVGRGPGRTLGSA